MNKLVKKLICVMTLLVLIGCFSVSAVEQKVYDDASLFSDQEIAALQERATELAESYQMDIVILTSNDVQGKTSIGYAEDFYDEHGFGYGSQNSGLALLINMQDRKVAISTTGEAIRYFTDDRINQILDQVYIFLKNGVYYDGAKNFLSNVDIHLSQGIPANQHNIPTEGYTPTPTDRVEKTLENTWIYLLISVAVGGIFVGILISVNKGRKTVNSETYHNENAFHMIREQDHYITTTMTQHKIERNTSSGSGGGSSTHTGSSGTTHGGGSRSF